MKRILAYICILCLATLTLFAQTAEMVMPYVQQMVISTLVPVNVCIWTYVGVQCSTIYQYQTSADTYPMKQWEGRIRSYDLYILGSPAQQKPQIPIYIPGFCSATDAAKHAEKYYPRQVVTVNASQMPCWRPVGAF